MPAHWTQASWKTSILSTNEIHTFTCVESAFQACKCIDRINEFKNLNGFEAKKLGRKVQLRSDWEQVKLPIMKSLVTIKFQQNPDLYERLNAITGLIVEENTWGDTFWGQCNGVGENHLGKILMELRRQLI